MRARMSARGDPPHDAERSQDRRLEGFGIEIVERVPIPGRAASKRREAY
jgi:GTP cyclohydrolase II